MAGRHLDSSHLCTVRTGRCPKDAQRQNLHLQDLAGIAEFEVLPFHPAWTHHGEGGPGCAGCELCPTSWWLQKFEDHDDHVTGVDSKWISPG